MEPGAGIDSHAARSLSIAAWILAALALGCDIAYVSVIAQEGNFSFGWPVVVFVAAYALGLAASAVAGRRASDPGVRSAFLSWAAAGSMATGVAGAFSLVFVPLLPAGAVLLAVTSRSERERVSPVWSALAVFVLVAGLVAANVLESQ
jgi:hypothetical protein